MTIKHFIILKLFFKDLFYVCKLSCLNVYIYTTFVLDALRGQKKVSTFLELELYMVLSHCMGAGN